MRLRIYSVYDSAAQFYGSPFCARAEGDALRSFIEFVSDPKSVGFKYPAQFSLAFLGEIEDTSGVITALSGGPSTVISGSQCVQEVSNGDGKVVGVQ